jgi:hypothetical protein
MKVYWVGEGCSIVQFVQEEPFSIFGVSLVLLKHMGTFTTHIWFISWIWFARNVNVYAYLWTHLFLSNVEKELETCLKTRDSPFLCTNLNATLVCIIKQGSLVQVAPACTWSGEGSDHFGPMYTAFPWISARGCFHDLNPWSHCHKATALPLCQGSSSLVCIM